MLHNFYSNIDLPKLHILQNVHNMTERNDLHSFVFAQLFVYRFLLRCGFISHLCMMDPPNSTQHYFNLDTGKNTHLRLPCRPTPSNLIRLQTDCRTNAPLRSLSYQDGSGIKLALSVPSPSFPTWVNVKWEAAICLLWSEVVRDSNSKEWDCRQFYLIQVHSYDIDLFSETLVCRTPLGRPLHAQYSQVRWCSPGILAYWTNGDLVIIGIRIEAARTCPLLLMMDTSLMWTPFLRPQGVQISEVLLYYAWSSPVTYAISHILF